MDEKKRHKLTSEEARRIGRNGGIASGKARRMKKMMRDNIEYMLFLPLYNEEGQIKTKSDLKAAVKSLQDMDGQNFTAMNMLLAGILSRALEGSQKDIEWLFKLTGVDFGEIEETEEKGSTKTILDAMRETEVDVSGLCEIQPTAASDS